MKVTMFIHYFVQQEQKTVFFLIIKVSLVVLKWAEQNNAVG